MSYRDHLLTSDSRLPGAAGDRRLAAALSPRRLEVFRVTAATGSVTKAARLLDLSQPTVSQHIQALETELGSGLFHRNGNGLSLTDLGGAFLAYAEGILRQQEDLQLLLAEVRGRRSPPLRIAGIPSVLHSLLPAALARLLRERADQSFDLKEGETTAVLETVAAGQADLGFVDPGAADQIPEGLTVEEVLFDPWYLIAGPGRELPGAARSGPVTASDAPSGLTETVQLPLNSRAGQPARGWFDQMAPGHSVLARAQSYPMLLNLVRGGLGVAMVPGLTLRRLGLQDLQSRRLDLPGRRIAAVFPARRGHKARSALIESLRAEGPGGE